MGDVNDTRQPSCGPHMMFSGVMFTSDLPALTRCEKGPCSEHGSNGINSMRENDDGEFRRRR